MLRNHANPFYAGIFEKDIGIKPTGDGMMDDTPFQTSIRILLFL